MSNGCVDLDRHNDETELMYIMRIGSYKESGLIDMTWKELANVFNKNLRDDGSEWTESAYRKKYQGMKRYESLPVNHADETEELKNLKRELEKEKVKVRDERNEYRRLIREEARKESYMDQIVSAIERSASKYCLEYKQPETDIAFKDTSMIIPLSDLHTGIEYKNFWNEFNEDVLKKRLNHYLDRIFEIQARHGCSEAFVVISEVVSGIIHPTLRIESNMDLIDQFLTAMDYISDFISELSKRFKNISVYVVPGNHSRLNPKKDQDIAHENMDNLIIPFLSAKMQNFKTVYFGENTFDQSIAVFPVRKLVVAAAHGDKDTPQNVVEHIQTLVNVRPNICLLGHRHTNAMITDGNVKVVQTGCLCGIGDYEIGLRLRNKPEQTVLIINDEEGLDCLYDVKF